MSTKTTFKRVALVAVASMGFGVLTSVAPASAASGSFTTDAASYTVVGGTATNASAVIRLSVKSDAATPVAQGLGSGETITASVTAVPTGVTATKTVTSNAADLSFKELTRADTAGTAPTYAAESNAILPSDGAIGAANTAHSNYAATVINSYYYLAVVCAANCMDQGEYTVRLRMNVSGGFVVQESTVKVKFVTSAADSGAKITITQTGSIQQDQLMAFTTDNNVTVAVTDANSGRIQEYASLYNNTPPTIAAVTTNGTTGAVLDTFLFSDLGVAGRDHVAPSTNAAGVALSKIADGTFGLYTDARTTLSTSYVSTTVTTKIRVRYGATTASITASIIPTIAAATATTVVTGTGVTNPSANTWTVPLTTTSVVVSVTIKDTATAVVQNTPVTFTPTWSGTAQTGDVSPVSATPVTVKTNSSGVATLTLTNSPAISGGIATVAISGLSYGLTAPSSQTITWSKAVPYLMSKDPSGTKKVAAKSTNTVTFTVTDAFGAPVAGELVSLAIDSSNDVNDGADTKTIPSVKTDAAGKVSYTWTDAGSAALDTDSITATSTTDSTVTATAVIAYATTVPVIATLTGYYNRDETGTTYTDLVPAGAMLTAAYGSYTVVSAMDYSKAITLDTSATDSQIKFQYVAKDSAGAVVTGVPVTITASAGGHILDSCTGASAKVVTSLTCYPATGGLITFNTIATGAAGVVYTVTAGTVSSTATVSTKNAAADARYVAITGDTTGTTFTTTKPLLTAKVTDRFGNGVPDATLTFTHTGVGSISGGAKFSTYTTDKTGAVSFYLDSTNEGSATISVAAAATSSSLSDLAGYVGLVEFDSTLTAGVKSASATVLWAAGTNSADVAADAAAEATDAANAATDAANAAAEAADAATAAAQDAADAVAALSAQVASLISGLKSQLTALTNLVIKIQKKVKA